MMSGIELRSIRRGLQLNQKELGEALDLSDRTIRAYEQEEKIIPKTVEMALMSLINSGF